MHGYLKGRYSGVVGTTDFHSHLRGTAELFNHLRQFKDDLVVVDSGDFFEGTAEYLRGGGVEEMRLLADVYDVLTPGNHGWRHYFNPTIWQKTVSANILGRDAQWAFNEFVLVNIDGLQFGITGVMSREAFSTIDLVDRCGYEVLDPAAALTDLVNRESASVDGWIILSHSGVDADIRLLRVLPPGGANVVLSGHCHSLLPEPVWESGTLLAKAPELGRGYAQVLHREPSSPEWEATHVDVAVDDCPDAPGTLESLGSLDRRFSERKLLPSELARSLTEALANAQGGAAVLLNHSTFRERGVGRELSREDLLALEPFQNQLVSTPIPACVDISNLPRTLEPIVGPVEMAYGNQSGEWLITTDYLARNFLGDLPGTYSISSLAAAAVSLLLVPEDEDTK